MSKRYAKYPKMKEVNPGYSGAKSGTKVKRFGNPLGARVLGRKGKGGGIFRATKGKIK